MPVKIKCENFRPKIRSSSVPTSVCRIPSEESAGALEMSKEAAQFINNEQLVMQKLSIKMGAKMVECQPGRVFG